jgi:hypothetical protein
VVVPLALGGTALFYSHFPPFGAIAGTMLAVAAWQFLTLHPAFIESHAKSAATVPASETTS